MDDSFVLLLPVRVQDGNVTHLQARQHPLLTGVMGNAKDLWEVCVRAQNRQYPHVSPGLRFTLSIPVPTPKSPS